MGDRSAYYKALGIQPEEEKKEQATGTRAAYYTALADNDEQTPATASASGYNSLALPTPDEWANRYMGELGANLRLNTTQQKTQPAQTQPTQAQPVQAKPTQTAGASMALPTPEEWANRAQGELSAALRTVPGGSVTVQPTQRTTTTKPDYSALEDKLRAAAPKQEEEKAEGFTHKSGKIDEPSEKTPTRLERIGNTAKAAGLGRVAGNFNAAGVAMESRGGTAATELYEEELESIKKRREALATQMRDDPAYAKDSEAVWQLSQYDDRIQTLEEAIRANKGTAKEIYKAADELQEESSKASEEAQRGASKVRKLALKVGQSAADMVIDRLESAIVPSLGLAAMGLRSFGSSAQEARREGANLGQQKLYGLGNAATEVGSELMFDFVKIAGFGGMDDLVESVISKVAKTPAAYNLLKVGASALGESVEEAVAGAIEPGLKAIYDDEKFGSKKHYNKETILETLESMLIGGLLGGAGGAVRVGVNTVANRDESGLHLPTPEEWANRNSRAATETSEEAKPTVDTTEATEAPESEKTAQKAAPTPEVKTTEPAPEPQDAKPMPKPESFTYSEWENGQKAKTAQEEADEAEYWAQRELEELERENARAEQEGKDMERRSAPPTPEEVEQVERWRQRGAQQAEDARQTDAEEYRATTAEEDAEAEYARMEREGKQMERTVPPKAPKSRAALKQQVQELLSIPDGKKGRANEIVDGIADDIQNGRDISEERMGRLFDALHDLGAFEQQADTYFREFRNTVKGSKIFVSPEIRAEFGEDWKSFASRARKAGITLTDNINDKGPDVHAAELAEIYGMLDTQAHPAQQLEQIVDTAERGKVQTMTAEELEDILRGEYGDEMVQQRMEDMERKFRQVLDLFRQGAETEVEVRSQADKKIQKAQERNAAWTKQQMERQQARFDQRFEKAKQQAKERAKHQMERRALAELQNKTMKQLQWLSKNRKKTNSEMRARFDSVLRDIDTIAINTANEMHIDNQTGMTWRDLADLYKKARESDPNFIPSKRLEDIVKRLDGEKIGDMDYKALEDLYKAAVGLRTEYYNRNNVINDELGRTFADAYHASLEEFADVKGFNKDKGETKGAMWFNRQQLTPTNYLRSLVGWKKGSTFASFVKQLENGERAYKKYVVDSAKQLEKFIKENKDWVRRADGQGKDGIWYEYEVPELVELHMGDKPIYGKTVKVHMTPTQRVHLALEAENYDNLRHMTGGRTFANKELYSKGKRAEAYAYGTTIKMSPEFARKIASELTPEEKALKNVLSKYYNGYAKDEINRVSNLLYGYDRAMSDNYAPIFTDENYVGHQAGVSDSTVEGVGSLKERQTSDNPSYNIGAFDAFERHVDQMARFVGYSIPIRNMETLMNWRGKNDTLRKAISDKWGGEAGTKYIDKLLAKLQTTKYTEEGAVQGLANKLLSNYVSSVFGFNPGIVLKQAASFPQAAALLGYKTLPTLKQLRNVNRELIGKYTAELDYRGLGYATPETATLKNNPGLLQRNKAMNFLFGGGAITAMDAATVQSIWPWAENYVAKNFPKLEKGTQEQIDAGESPFYQKVAEVFNDAVSTTQPMYDTMHRAKIMTTKDGADRALTMFKTVPLQQYNTLRRAFGELQAAKKSGDAAERKTAARNAANAITATLGSAAALEAVELLNQAWKNGLKGYRDDDDELTAGSAAKKVAERIVGDLAGITIGGSEISDFIFNLVNGKKWYGIEIPGGEQLNDVVDTIWEAGKTATKFVQEGSNVLNNGGDLGEYYRMHGAEYADALNEVAEKFAMYFKGLPVQNVKKYLGAGLRIASPELYAQIEDSINAPSRATLKKTDEKLLPTRFQDMMEQRMDMAGIYPKESSEELARLYKEYGSEVAPPDVPKKFNVKRDDDSSEEITLNAYQTQVYEGAFREAAKPALAGIGQDKELRSLDDDAKAAYLKRLYDVAGDYAKSEVDEDYDGDYTERIKALQNAGIPIQSIVNTMAMKAALPDAQFAAWLDTGVYRGKTLETVKDVLGVKNTYEALKETGLDDEAIFTVTDALDELKPEEKGGSVTKWQKLEAIAGLDLSQDEIDKAASAYLTEGQMEGYRESGLGLGEYTEALRKKEATEADKDKDGEAIPGSKRMKVMELVDGMDLTDKEKDRLFQALGYEGENKWNTAYTGDDYAAYAGMTDSQRSTYMKYCDWMDAGDYARYSESIGDFHDIKDSSGKTVVTRKAQVIEYINALPLLDDQKTALYVAMGYNPNMTDKGFADCPWWNSLQLRTQYYPK